MQPFFSILAILSLLMISTGGVAAGRPYEVVQDFLQYPDDHAMGAVAGVAIDSRGRLIVTHRGPRPVLVFDPSGNLVRAFGDELLTAVHGTRIDSRDNIWVTDMRRHTVIKFSPEGEVLLHLGVQGKSGDDDRHFNRPTDVAFAPNGDFFVSDGYGNNRVVKFRPDGTFLKAWGVKGTDSGEFHLPHGIVIDAEGLLHVSDRENDRIQVFDLEGRYVRQYGGFASFGLVIAEDQTLYVADGRAHQVIQLTLDGRELQRWGSEGSRPGQFDLPHGIAVAKDGTVYVTEITGQRIQKFVPRPAADR